MKKTTALSLSVFFLFYLIFGFNLALAQTPYLSSVNVSPSTITLNTNGTQQLTITPRDQFGTSFGGVNTTYTSSNPSVATVNSNGMITAVGPGTATITATSASGSNTVTGTSTVTVTSNTSPYLNNITISPSTSNLNTNGTQQLTINAQDQFGSSFSGANTTYTSSNSSVATVNSNGMITAVGPGTATITATSTYGGRTVTGISTVTVGTGSGSPYLNSVILTPSSITLNTNGTQQLAITPQDQFGASFTGGANTTYTSNNPSVATVNNNGMISAVGPGTATITATSTNGGRTVTSTSTVTVSGTTTQNPPSACSGITFTRVLKQGMSGNDVKCLQAILNTNVDTKVTSSGSGSPGNETTHFGSLTKQAVINFQDKYATQILTPLGLQSGTGVFGNSSIAQMNRLFKLQ